MITWKSRACVTMLVKLHAWPDLVKAFDISLRSASVNDRWYKIYITLQGNEKT